MCPMGTTINDSCGWRDDPVQYARNVTALECGDLQIGVIEFLHELKSIWILVGATRR